MEIITITNGVLIALTIGLTQIIKPFIADRFITLVPLALGVMGTGFTVGFSPASVITGLIIGLTSQGLFDHKTVITG